MMGISFEEAKNITNQTRNVSFRSGRKLHGAWIDSALREKGTDAEMSTGFSCCVANQDDIVVHATTLVDGGMEPVCRGEKRAAGTHFFKGSVTTVETVEKAFSEFGGRFCADCQSLLRASLKVQVERFYG